MEKAVDCLRILTTGNDMNKLSLFSIPVGVRSLVRIMTTHEASEVSLLPCVQLWLMHDLGSCIPSQRGPRPCQTEPTGSERCSWYACR